jgi:uncharacterized protein (TIGR03067 family)
MKLACVALFALGFVAATGGPLCAADEAAEKEKLAGTWESYSFEAVGQPKNAKTVKLVFSGDKTVATVGGIETTYEVSLDVDKPPYRIQLVPIVGRIKMPQQTNKGLYQLDGDRLTVCLGGSKRPGAFELRPKTDDVLMKLRRR